MLAYQPSGTGAGTSIPPLPLFNRHTSPISSAHAREPTAPSAEAINATPRLKAAIKPTPSSALGLEPFGLFADRFNVFRDTSFHVPLDKSVTSMRRASKLFSTLRDVRGDV
jgi:hypothetical protein